MLAPDSGLNQDGGCKVPRYIGVLLHHYTSEDHDVNLHGRKNLKYRMYLTT